MASMWDWLRLTRSNPPGLANTDEAAAELYRAALEQFEQLMRAAAEVGPASRPLPLFYALSQAGRAVVAARGGREHQHHGLTLDRDVPAELLEASVKPQEQARGLGQFQEVAACVGSPTIATPVELGALCRALPEVSGELLASTPWPRAMPIFLVPWDKVPMHGHTRISLDVEEEAVTMPRLAEILKKYPAASKRITVNKAVAALPTLPVVLSPSGQAIDLIWIGDEADLESVVPQYRYWDWRWLRPAVTADAAPPPSPLMTWWLLLYGLSMLARYFPVPWTRALDLDRSPAAVMLELVMTRAIDALPHLIYEAVLDRTVRFPARTGPDPFER